MKDVLENELVPDERSHAVKAAKNRAESLQGLPVERLGIYGAWLGIKQFAPHGPALPGGAIDSTMLIDATAKGDLPPVALPKKEFMDRARSLWEELGLPALTPESPWSGYSLGDWSSEWDACAARAAAGDWLANGRRSAAHRSATAKPQDPARGIVLDPA